MKGSISVDVLVVGGGPAGSCTAGACKDGRLGSSGRRKEIPPGAHRGIIARHVDAVSAHVGCRPGRRGGGFRPQARRCVRWGPQGQRMRLGMPPPGLRLPGATGSLRRSAVDPCSGMRGTGQPRGMGALPRQGDDGGIRGAEVQLGEETHHVSARFVLDASGLFRFVPRKPGLASTMEGRQRIAVGCYYQGAGRPTPPSQDDIITEATENGWLWFIPLDSELTSVGLVTDADLGGGTTAAGRHGPSRPGHRGDERFGTNCQDLATSSIAALHQPSCRRPAWGRWVRACRRYRHVRRPAFLHRCSRCPDVREPRCRRHRCGPERWR